MEDFFLGPASLFSAPHLVSVTVTLAIFITVAVLLGKKFKGDTKKQNIVMIISAILIVGFQVAKMIYLLARTDNIGDCLIGNAPLYFCDIMIYIIPITVFVRGRAKDCCYDFIAICGLLMGFMGNYFAGNIYNGTDSAFSFLAINSLINHSISAFVSMFVFVSGLNKMEKRNIPFVVGILFVYMTFALIMAYITGKNYMFYFRGDGTPFTIFFDLVGGNLAPYQIIIYVLQCGYIGLFYLVYYYTIKLVKYVKEKHALSEAK